MTAKTTIDEKDSGVPVEVVLDKDLKIKYLRYRKITIGSVDLIRNRKILPSQKHPTKMADLCIRLEARHHVPDCDVEPFSLITKSNNGLVTVDRDQEAADWPFLKVHPQFASSVTFIRQSKTTTYRYPASAVVRKPDHFTAHVRVDVTKIREYSFVKHEFNEFVVATISLDTLPPLCHQDLHRDLVKNILALAIEMGNSIS
jgi:hypothetical protein